MGRNVKSSAGKAAAGVGVIGVLVLGQSQIAFADTETTSERGTGTEITVEGDDRRAELQNASAVLDSYSERDVLELLLAGKGPIADGNPGIEASLGFHPDREQASDEMLDDVVDAYLEFNPDFVDEHLPLLQSGDPQVFEPALVKFYEGVVDFVETDPLFEETREVIDAATEAELRTGDGRNSQNAQTVHNLHAAVNASAAVNVAATVNAGVAVVAVAVVLVAVVYLDDDSASPMSNVDSDGLMRDLSDALS